MDYTPKQRSSRLLHTWGEEIVTCNLALQQNTYIRFGGGGELE